MRRDLQRRLIACVTALCTFSTMLAVPALADNAESSATLAKPSVISVTWQSPMAVLGAQQGAQEFTLTTRVGNGEVKLYLSFPTVGGIRLRTDQQGFFTPVGLKTIRYAKAADGSVTMTAGATTVVYKPGSSWKLELCSLAGKVLDTIAADQIFFGYQGSTLKKVKLAGMISGKEGFYGLGERFNALNQVGSQILLWNQDGYNQLLAYDGDRTVGYKNVPILYSTKGYTLFFNSYYSAVADIGKTSASQYSLDFNGPQFDVYFWTGTPQENLTAYTGLTGTSVLPPKWAFEYLPGGGGQVWNAQGSENELNVVKECLEGYKKLGTPIAGLYGEGSPSADSAAYQLLKQYNTRMLTWYWSAMGVSEMYQYLPGMTDAQVPKVVKNSDRSTVMPGEYIDFTNPQSVTLIYNYFKKLWTWGLRGSMVDFGDNIFEDSVFSNGMTGDQMHNFYAYWYNKGYHDAWQKGLGNDYLLFSRSGAAGSQHWIAQFGGDHPSTFQGLRDAVVGGITASTAGFSIWGSDIGGYGQDNSPPSADCFIRWMQFGAFSPLMRAHGTTDRNPWTYGALAEKVYQNYYWLRENLLNDIYSAAIRSNKQGVSLIQPMTFAYPDDQGLTSVQDQYMFLNDFLVAPVLSNDAYERSIVFPKGSWVSLLDGRTVSGGKTVDSAAPEEAIPVYLRAGAAVPVQVSSSTLSLMDNMQKGRTDALLVAPGGSRTSQFWSDASHSVTYKTADSDNSFKISVPAPSGIPVVIAYGVSASGVKVGSKSLRELDAMPVSGLVGYYVDPVNHKTVIRLPKGSWTEVTIETGGKGPADLAAGKNAVASRERTENYKAVHVTDPDISSTWYPGQNGSGDWIYVDLGSEQDISTVVLKWTNRYAGKYKLQVSNDATDDNLWTDVYTQNSGYGGIEQVGLKPVKARYVRMLVTAEPAEGGAELYGFEVYAPHTQSALSSNGVWKIAIPTGAAVILAGTAILAFLAVRSKRRAMPGPKAEQTRE